MSAADLQAFVGAYEGTDDKFLTQCWDEAERMVADYIGSVDLTGRYTIPEVVRHRACLEVGSELFHRKNAPHGVAQFATFDGSPVRVARDPMVGAYPILRRYLPGGFA